MPARFISRLRTPRVPCDYPSANTASSLRVPPATGVGVGPSGSGAEGGEEVEESPANAGGQENTGKRAALAAPTCPGVTGAEMGSVGAPAPGGSGAVPAVGIRHGRRLVALLLRQVGFARGEKGLQRKAEV